MSGTLIVGGGLAGGAAATLLARAGTAVTLFEREAEPHDKVCGEFLSVEAADALAALGLDVRRLGAAPIAMLRLAWRGRLIEAPLPFVAMGLTRRRLDAALLEVAEAAGAHVERGVAVRAIDGACAETSKGVVAVERLLLATGKHEVRGQPRDVTGCDTGFVGFKSHWRLPQRARAGLTGMIDVVLFEGGYAGLQLVEGGIANLCLLVRKRRLSALGGWPELLATLLREPHLARHLDEAEMLHPRPLAIAGVPYGLLPPREGGVVFRLGDQAAVIPSFCGDGMAIALHSARVAAETIARGGNAGDHHRRLRRDLARQIRLAMRLQRLGEHRASRPLVWGAMTWAPALAPMLVKATRVRA